MVSFKETETNKNFDLFDCGKCSGWKFEVMCDRNSKYGVINITKCRDEDKYTTTVTGLDENCDFDSWDYPTSKDELVKFLSEHFSRIESNDACEEFNQDTPICPDCGDDTVESYDDAY